MHVCLARLAFQTTVQKITTVKLNTRFGRADRHHSATGRFVDLCGKRQLVRTGVLVEYPVMIEPTTEGELFVLDANVTTDRFGSGEIKWCARNLWRLSRRNQTYVDGRVLRRADHQFVVKNRAFAFAL